MYNKVFLNERGLENEKVSDIYECIGGDCIINDWLHKYKR